LSLVHGAFSQQAITPVAEVLAERVLLSAPVLRAYPFLVDLWAQETAIVLLLRRALDKQGVVDHNGVPRDSLHKWISSHTRTAMQLLREAGLTRKVAAELQLDIAQAAQAAMGAAHQASKVPGPVREFLEQQGFPSPVEVLEGGEAS